MNEFSLKGKVNTLQELSKKRFNFQYRGLYWLSISISVLGPNVNVRCGIDRLTVKRPTFSPAIGVQLIWVGIYGADSMFADK